ncbi:hypothetical protein LDENG_00127580, partial [Lucifuga dentata]
MKSAPWFSDDMCALKRNCRKHERRWRITKLDTSRLAWVESFRKYKRALSAARTAYFSRLINNNKNNPRFLFHTVAKLTQNTPKLLERAVANQLTCHLSNNNLFDKFQSGFRSCHSTEAALTRVVNDLFITADSDSTSLLLFLDLSAAFDTVDHNILLSCLEK